MCACWGGRQGIGESEENRTINQNSLLDFCVKKRLKDKMYNSCYVRYSVLFTLATLKQYGVCLELGLEWDPWTRWPWSCQVHPLMKWPHSGHTKCYSEWQFKIWICVFTSGQYFFLKYASVEQALNFKYFLFQMGLLFKMH